MKEITLDYIRDWKVSNKFDEIYHKQVSIVWKLDKSVLTQDDIEQYIYFKEEDYDWKYIWLVNIENKENYPRIYVWSSLKKLLEKNGYFDYESYIRVFWEFWSIPTTKSNIWKIWKADILDEEWNIIKTVEDKSMKN